MMHRRQVTMIFLAAMAVAVTGGCRQPGVPGPSEDELRAYLDVKEEEFEDICVDLGGAIWNLYTGEGGADQSAYYRRFGELFSEDSLRTVIAHCASRTDSLTDRALARRVELWKNILTAAKVNYAEDISLLQSNLETWLAEEYSTAGRPSAEELESMTLDLIRLRNDRARTIGYDDYAGLVFEVTEVGEGWIEEWVALLESRTREPYRRLVRLTMEETGKDTIDHTDVRTLVRGFMEANRDLELEQESFGPVMRETIENTGISYDELPLRFVEKQLPAGIGGQGFAIRIPEDFRAVVLPILPFPDRMHELGHGLQWMFTRADSPVLEGYEWCMGNECPAWAEGMAETMANFTRNPRWLERYTGASEAEFTERTETIRRLAPAAVRFSLITFLMERELYRDPDRDAGEIMASLEEEYLLVEADPSMTVPLASMLYVSYPLYIQNYAIADVIAWQIHETLEKRFGDRYVFDDDVGPWLIRNCWEQGELSPWQEKLRRATGRELDVDGYLNSLGL